MSDIKEESRKLNMLEMCGTFFIHLVAQHNIPLSPDDFQKKIKLVSKRTGITEDDLQKVYPFLQAESYKLSLGPKKPPKQIGFKTQQSEGAS
ncbi:MAG: hypothetical protein QG551_74 [Patescibacteria group bacterium]|jgi:hypothetical protein|nr:hypothetical protein [Patescibacteria group bacterium]